MKGECYCKADMDTTITNNSDMTMLYLPSIMTNSKCLAALSFEASISPQMFLQLLSQCQICSSRESALLIQQRYHTQRSLQGCAHKLSLSELLLSQPNSIMWSMHILAKDGGKPETWMDVCASIMEVHVNNVESLTCQEYAMISVWVTIPSQWDPDILDCLQSQLLSNQCSLMCTPATQKQD
jgi:hypothetical protein